MKDKLKRLFKVLPCLVAVVLVLLVSVVIPAYAATYNLYPIQDMLTGVEEAGGFKTATYDFFSGNLVPCWVMPDITTNAFNANYTFTETYPYAVELRCYPFDGTTMDVDRIDIGSIVDYENFVFNSKLLIGGTFSGTNPLSLSGYGEIIVYGNGNKILETYSAPLEFTTDNTGNKLCNVRVPFELTSESVSISCVIKIYASHSKFYAGDKISVSVLDGELVASKPFFISAVTDAFGSVVDWVSIVVNSLVDDAGSLRDLLPLLVVGVSVSALLLGIKIFRRFTWGS